MIEWILSSSVLILVVIALRFILRGKISLRLQYALWAIVLIRLALPMSLVGADFSVMEAVVQTEIYEDLDRTMHITQVHSGALVNTELSYEEAKEAHDGTLHEIKGYGVQSGYGHLHTYLFQDSLSLVLGRILKTVWLLGAISMALYLLGSNLLFGWQLRKTRKAFETASALPVYVSTQIQTPCMYGLLRPAIYLTEEIAEDPAALRHVLAHEVTHYHHKDHIWSALRCAALALHWYNPQVWWAAILSRRDAELACDEGAIRRLGEEERVSYGSTLIGLSCTTKRAEGVLLTATTMTGSKRSLKERIVLIAKKPKTAAIALAVVVCVLFVGILCTFTGARHKDSLFRRYPSFTEWTESLSADEIQWAEASKDYGVDKVSYTLTESDYEDLVGIFKNLGKDDFSRKDPGGASTNVHLPLYRQDKLWLFKCLDDGTVGLMFNDAETGAYFGCEGRYLIIYSKELWNYIANTVEEKGLSNQTVPSPVVYMYDTTSPSDVMQFAADYAAEQAKQAASQLHMGSITAVSVESIVEIGSYSEGTAGLNLYLLDYWMQTDTDADLDISDEYVMRRGKIYVSDPAYMTYLVVGYNEDSYHLICTMRQKELYEYFNSNALDEFMDAYSNEYDAAATLFFMYEMQKYASLPVPEFADALRSAGGVQFILEAAGGTDYICQDEALIDELEIVLASYEWRAMENWPEAHGEICQAKVTVTTPDWEQVLRVCSCGSIQYVSGNRSSFYYSISDDLSVPHPFDFLYEVYLELDQAAKAN